MTTSPDAETLDLLWGVNDITAFLNLTPRQAEHKIKQGQLPVAKNGGKLFAFKSGLRKYLGELLEGRPDAPPQT